mmetsp:Transcript_28219/g.70999  ORF Transcript_28219/g.70999 Transcript_28219/m.70999 type:complete len:225 (+) Transcript_28219:289-963(+)
MFAGMSKGASKYCVKIVVAIALLFCPAVSHMIIRLFAVGVQLTTSPTSQSASRMCTSRGITRAAPITNTAANSGIRTILARTMARLVPIVICSHEGPFESVAPSKIKFSGTAAAPIVCIPPNSQPSGAVSIGTSNAFARGVRPTTTPTSTPTTAGLRNCPTNGPTVACSCRHATHQPLCVLREERRRASEGKLGAQFMVGTSATAPETHVAISLEFAFGVAKAL